MNWRRSTVSIVCVWLDQPNDLAEAVIVANHPLQPVILVLVLRIGFDASISTAYCQSMLV